MRGCSRKATVKKWSFENFLHHCLTQQMPIRVQLCTCTNPVRSTARAHKSPCEKKNGVHLVLRLRKFVLGASCRQTARVWDTHAFSTHHHKMPFPPTHCRRHLRTPHLARYHGTPFSRFTTAQLSCNPRNHLLLLTVFRLTSIPWHFLVHHCCYHLEKENRVSWLDHLTQAIIHFSRTRRVEVAHTALIHSIDYC